MKTLTLTKQDGSRAGRWMEVDVESDTPVIGPGYGQSRQGAVDDRSYIHGFLFLHDDVSASADTQAEFNRFAAEWKHETDYLSSLAMFAEHRPYQEIIGMGKESIIVVPSEDVSASIGTQTEFDQLAAEWKHETAHLSSLNMIVEHRAYQEIIGMGKEAIPMILQDLNEAPAQWFWALRSISRESPVRPEDRGDVDAMTAAWLEWGKRRHYV